MNTNTSNNTNIFCVHKRLDIRKIRLIRDIRVQKKNLMFTRKIPYSAVPSRVSVEHSCYSCSQEKSHVHQSLPAQAWNIRVIRVIRVQKKNLMFTRKIPYSAVPSRISVEHSCYSSYSCSKEESRVQKKNPVFTRKLSVFPSVCKNNKNPLILQAIMRKITHIIIHCTATRADRSFSVQSLEASHKARGFITIGYHYYITRDGQVHPCRPESMVGAHAKHHNAYSIGICYEGGLDARGIPADTRTDAQKRSMAALLRSLRLDYPDACIIGHRDLPGVKKACPCFDVKTWLPSIGLHR